MSGIFLSYAREDLAKAERLAGVLETAGRSVWWDRHLLAGVRFTAEIDEALASADHVVVLWSAHSVNSAWVQDEAAAGRDSGRLIPVLLDGATPPLGFRQYQAIDLSAWTGRGQPKALRDLIASLDAKSPGQPASPAQSRAPKSAHRAMPRQALLAMTALALLATAGGVWLLLGRNGAPTLSVTATEPTTAASRGLAQQIALDLTRFRPATLEGLNVMDPADGRKDADYRAKISIDRDPGPTRADLSLLIRGRPGISWVNTIENRSGRLVDLRQQAASALSATVGCALEAGRANQRLPDTTFRMFLDACSAMTREFSSTDARDLVPSFTRITNAAPNFAPGQAMLALTLLSALPGNSETNVKPLVRAGRAALGRAKALDPTLEEVIAADAQWHRADSGQWDHAFPILERGLDTHPNSALLLGIKAEKLAAMGRMNDSTDAARQAVSYDALSPQVRVNLVDALIYADRVAEGRRVLVEAESIWPDSTALEDARFRIELRFGDPRVALAHLRARHGALVNPIPFDKSWENFLLARSDPSPAHVEAALDTFRERYRRDAADVPAYLQALGTFGRNDEAFRVTANPVTLDSLQASTDILFRPHMRSLMADPRFMELASRLGLLAYWRKTDTWPDFCSDPKLAYDCRKEAKKYR